MSQGPVPESRVRVSREVKTSEGLEITAQRTEPT